MVFLVESSFKGFLYSPQYPITLNISPNSSPLPLDICSRWPTISKNHPLPWRFPSSDFKLTDVSPHPHPTGPYLLGYNSHWSMLYLDFIPLIVGSVFHYCYSLKKNYIFIALKFCLALIFFNTLHLSEHQCFYLQDSSNTLYKNLRWGSSEIRKAH